MNTSMMDGVRKRDREWRFSKQLVQLGRLETMGVLQELLSNDWYEQYLNDHLSLISFGIFFCLLIHSIRHEDQ